MSEEPRYLWFAPNAGLWPSFALEHRLAEALSDAGRVVTMVHCRGVLDAFCPVMAAAGLSADSSASVRRRECRECRHNSALAERAAGYDVLALDTVVTAAMKERARSVVAEVTRENWSDLAVDGIPVGRYATYLTLLNHKVPDVASTEPSWRDYRADLYDALLVLEAAPVLLERLRPTHVVMYNPLYPSNRMLVEVAIRRGLRLVGVHAGGYIPARYETVGVYHHISASQTMVDSPAVAAALEVPCTPVEISAVGRHLRALMGGSDPWVYSAAPSRKPASATRADLGLRPASPVVVVLLSSPDETRSSMMVDAEYLRDSDAGYSDIAEFITATRTAAAAMPAVDFVMRLHPRLLPNKREAVVSPDLAPIMAALADLPPNVHVNAPGQGLSLYDLAVVASAALNQSSSAGLEFLALGIPLVQYDPVRQNAYRPEFSVSAGRLDESALVEAIVLAIGQGWRLENSRNAFRWYATSLLRVLLHLQGLESEPGQGPQSEPAAVPADASGSAALRVARSVVPDSVREKGARWLDRRSRAATLPSAHGVWTAEWLHRIDATVGVGPLWNPPVVRRGEGDLDDEGRALRSELIGLLALLGVTPGPGMGVLTGAFDDLREW